MTIVAIDVKQRRFLFLFFLVLWFRMSRTSATRSPNNRNSLDQIDRELIARTERKTDTQICAFTKTRKKKMPNWEIRNEKKTKNTKIDRLIGRRRHWRHHRRSLNDKIIEKQFKRTKNRRNAKECYVCVFREQWFKNLFSMRNFVYLWLEYASDSTSRLTV